MARQRKGTGWAFRTAGNVSGVPVPVTGKYQKGFMICGCMIFVNVYDFLQGLKMALLLGLEGKNIIKKWQGVLEPAVMGGRE